jgi:hypothetical protein
MKKVAQKFLFPNKLFYIYIIINKTEIMKTIAQQLNIKAFPFEIRNEQGNLIYIENEDSSWSRREYDSECRQTYFEDSNQCWVKRDYDSNGNQIYYENSEEYWEKSEYDNNGNKIYYENLSGWIKWEYDFNGNEIYYENSRGEVRDNRPRQ